MRTRFVCVSALALGWAVIAPVAARADAPPAESRPFALDGQVTGVDAARERVILAGDDKHIWTLDTSSADIVLPDGSKEGMTTDLAPGMRVHVSGRQLSVGIAAVQTLRVLGQRATAPAALPAAPQATLPAADAGATLQIRGTVASVDTRLGAFVVRVRDHTRTVYLADDTDLSGLAAKDPSRFPVKAGDRVTVEGRLQPDGGILAGAVSLSPTITLPPAAMSADRVLFGRISSTSNRYTGRDIKIRLADDREVKIKVRRGLAIRRAGRPISVHDLRGEDDVRVTGRFDGKDFQAARIDVLHRDAAEDPSAPGQRGL